MTSPRHRLTSSTYLGVGAAAVALTGSAFALPAAFGADTRSAAPAPTSTATSVATGAATSGVLPTRVVRVTTRRVAIPARTVRRADPRLAPGTTRVRVPGHAGLRRVHYRDIFVGGRLVTRRVHGSVLLRNPVTRVVAVGTQGRASRSDARSVAGTAGLNWAALARCESGGNPRAVSPAGYYGLYQFSPSTWRAVGGHGNPAAASPAEQTLRAQMLYARSGAGQWPVCGRHL